MNVMLADLTYTESFEALLEACTPPQPPAKTGVSATPAIRMELVLRCRAMIEDGRYETEARTRVAVERLAAALR